jgi:hypothetical protein
MHSIDREAEPTMRTAEALVFQKASLAEAAQSARRRRGRHTQVLGYTASARPGYHTPARDDRVHHDILEDGPRRHADAPA